MNLMKYFRDKYLSDIKGSSILDVGSLNVNGSYCKLFRDYNYTGMDIVKGPNVDVVGYENIKTKFDIVVSGQVMEHVKQPWEWLKNLAKFHKKYICIIAPNKEKYHPYPIDTYRYFPDGMRDLFDYANIKEIEIFINKYDTIGIGGY